MLLWKAFKLGSTNTREIDTLPAFQPNTQTYVSGSSHCYLMPCVFLPFIFRIVQHLVLIEHWQFETAVTINTVFDLIISNSFLYLLRQTLNLTYASHMNHTCTIKTEWLLNDTHIQCMCLLKWKIVFFSSSVISTIIQIERYANGKRKRQFSLFRCCMWGEWLASPLSQFIALAMNARRTCHF